jgi:hypothetical protein
MNDELRTHLIAVVGDKKPATVNGKRSHFSFHRGDGRWWTAWSDSGRKQTARSRWVWTMLHGPIPDGYEIHHADFDRANDHPDNLELIDKYHHSRIHALHRQELRIVNGIEERKCPTCGEWKSKLDYGVARGRVIGKCAKCKRAYAAKWNAEHRTNPTDRTELNAYNRERRRLRARNYPITPADQWVLC